MQKYWFLPLILVLSACTQQSSKNAPQTADSNDPRVLVNISELVSSGGFTLENKDVAGSGVLVSTGIDLGQFSPPSRTDRVLVLTNNTSQPQALSEVSLSFNNQNFVIRTNRCTNSNLGVGKSCEISISFILHNEYNGIKTDLLKVKKGTEIFSIPLKAEIINHPPDVVGTPQIEVIFEEPFFTLPFSSSNLFKQVIVKNTSYNEIAPSSYLNVVLNDLNNQYAIRYNQCSVDLPPQGSCIISVYNNRIRVLRQENLLADKTANLLRRSLHN